MRTPATSPPPAGPWGAYYIVPRRWGTQRPQAPKASGALPPLVLYRSVGYRLRRWLLHATQQFPHPVQVLLPYPARSKRTIGPAFAFAAECLCILARAAVSRCVLSMCLLTTCFRCACSRRASTKRRCICPRVDPQFHCPGVCAVKTGGGMGFTFFFF